MKRNLPLVLLFVIIVAFLVLVVADVPVIAYGV
jgi:hypothetical protein